MAAVEENFTDLIIVGAGPAGLMAAAWASKYNVSARIIDDKSDRIQTGHADGLTCRTMEILDSFGIADIVVKESSHDILMKSWAPDAHGQAIERVATVVSQKEGVSDFQQCTLHQGRLEQLFQDIVEKDGKIKVERNVKTLCLKIDRKAAALGKRDEHPIKLQVEHNGSASAQLQVKTGVVDPATDPRDDRHRADPAPETSDISSSKRLEAIRAKYLIGCDGAHSWTRRQFDIKMKGETTDTVWGVLDIVPLTNFPDIRHTCAIQSNAHGGIHLVPREGKLVRFYIQLTEANVMNGRFDRSSVTPQKLLARAQLIMRPYALDYRICDWWSVYQVGQRIADHFSVQERVFFAGDAIHTHSPKVGQGMNVSFQDTYNLGWKICSVIVGLSPQEILLTYERERRPVALKLLEVDRVTSRYYAGQSLDGKVRPTGSLSEDLQTFRNRMYDFLSGVAVQYEPSLLVQARETISKSAIEDDIGKTESDTLDALLNQLGNSKIFCEAQRQQLARHIVVGRRMPASIVSNLANSRPTSIADLLTSTGQWRVLIFAGDVSSRNQMNRLHVFATAIGNPGSFLQLCRSSRSMTRTPTAGPLLGQQPPIEFYTILAENHDTNVLSSLPDTLHPYDAELGWDYDRVFYDETSCRGRSAYEAYGIDAQIGCVICCRPDQHVGYIGTIDDVNSLELYFDQIVIKRREV